MRYIQPYIKEDLANKMVFITGPRQCGKTTLAQSLLQDYDSGRYFNWDDIEHKKLIIQRHWSDGEKLIVLDEIPKFKKWKTFLKGTYDTQKNLHHFLVTGSSRLDLYRKGGDSMLGRYHLWHLHPFSLLDHPSELSIDEAFSRLMSVGGFHEPFLKNDLRQARRWRRDRLEKVLKEDIRELEEIKNIQGLQLLVELLRSRVGGLIIISNLAEDLQVSPHTVKHWITILESMYIIFQVKPYTNKLARSLQKPVKIYFYDNGDVDGDDGARFENLVANHLLKMVHFAQDFAGHQMQLGYLRDKEKHEVDFIITRDKKIVELIEVKLTDTEPSPHLKYFGEKLKMKNLIQVTSNRDHLFTKGNLRVSSIFSEFTNLHRYCE